MIFCFLGYVGVPLVRLKGLLVELEVDEGVGGAVEHLKFGRIVALEAQLVSALPLVAAHLNEAPSSLGFILGR